MVEGRGLAFLSAMLILGDVDSLVAGDEIAAKAAPSCVLRRLGVFLCAS
jgi:hypothetical protein